MHKKKYWFKASVLSQYSIEEAREFCGQGISPAFLVLVADLIESLNDLGVICLSMGDISINKMEHIIRFMLCRNEYSDGVDICNFMYEQFNSGNIVDGEDGKYKFAKQLDELLVDFYNPAVFFFKFEDLGPSEWEEVEEPEKL